MIYSDDNLPEWSKARMSDYAVLNATTEPWPIAKADIERDFGYPTNGGYVAWGPFVVEGIPALDGMAMITSMLLVGNPFTADQTPVMAFGGDRLHFSQVKGRVQALPDGDGVTWATPDGATIIVRSIRKSDAQLAGVPDSVTVEEIVAKVLDGIGDDE